MFYLCAHTPLTWIFMATSLPSFSLAKCTWPIDAAANGFSSKYSSLSLQFGPRSLLMAFCREKRNRLIYQLGLIGLCRFLQLPLPYHHLFRRHEVGTLSNTLEDFGQLRVNKGVIWEERKQQTNRGKKLKTVMLLSYCLLLNVENREKNTEEALNPSLCLLCIIIMFSDKYIPKNWSPFSFSTVQVKI